MSNVVYVLSERNLQDHEESIIGVAENPELIEVLINKHYGEHDVIVQYDMENMDVESLIWERTISITESGRYKLWLESFTLNG